jgi:hypothetical protein
MISPTAINVTILTGSGVAVGVGMDAVVLVVVIDVAV